MADQAWQVVAVLVDPMRRALYDHVRRQRHPVTREEAAQAVDISRNLAAFHLDKLVEAGVLRARYEAPADQPRGRGRAPKVYEVAGDGLSFSVPPRQYELVATILADAVAAGPVDAQAAALREAATLGHTIGAAARPDADAALRPSGRAAARQAGGVMDRAANTLAGLGYEPRPEDDGLVLDNCPFHALAARHTALICGLNLEFVGGVLSGLGCAGLAAELRPDPDACCVRVRPR